LQPFVNGGFKGTVRHRDNEERHGKHCRDDEALRKMFDFQPGGLLLGTKCIRRAGYHGCAKAGLLDDTDDFICGNRIRCADDACPARRKVYGRGDDSGCASKLAFDAARPGSTGHPGDV